MQLCIVHRVRNSLNYVGWNKRDQVAADLKLVYTAATVDEAEQHLTAFEEKWDDAYPYCTILAQELVTYYSFL